MFARSRRSALPASRRNIRNADFWVARGLCVLLGLMAVENLLTLLLEIYRPRVKGKIARPLYESRVAGLLAQPESLFTTAAQTLDYQFGFKVSETWFFQAVQKNLRHAAAGSVRRAAAVHDGCFRRRRRTGGAGALRQAGRRFRAGRAFQMAVAGGQDLPLPHGTDSVASPSATRRTCADPPAVISLDGAATRRKKTFSSPTAHARRHGRRRPGHERPAQPQAGRPHHRQHSGAIPDHQRHRLGL